MGWIFGVYFSTWKGSYQVRRARMSALPWAGLPTVTQLSLGQRLWIKIPGGRGVPSAFSHIPSLHLLDSW